MVGSAVVRRLQRAGFNEILTSSRSELDLLDRTAVRAFFEKQRPAIVVDAAAKVGGIAANNEQPVEFLLQNVTIQNNVIEAAADFGARKLLFLGSSCIYPKLAPQPIPESALLTGALEPTNEAHPCQDRRDQALPSLCTRIWKDLHLGHANEPLRTA
jgi:GDP-L-fucose synthase